MQAALNYSDTYRACEVLYTCSIRQCAQLQGTLYMDSAPVTGLILYNVCAQCAVDCIYSVQCMCTAQRCMHLKCLLNLHSYHTLYNTSVLLTHGTATMDWEDIGFAVARVNITSTIAREI